MDVSEPRCISVVTQPCKRKILLLYFLPCTLFCCACLLKLGRRCRQWRCIWTKVLHVAFQCGVPFRAGHGNCESSQYICITHVLVIHLCCASALNLVWVVKEWPHRDSSCYRWRTTKEDALRCQRRSNISGWSKNINGNHAKECKRWAESSWPSLLPARFVS